MLNITTAVFSGHLDLRKVTPPRGVDLAEHAIGLIELETISLLGVGLANYTVRTH